MPRSFSAESQLPMLTILWTSCRKLHPSRLWNPNHFVAVIPVFPANVQSSNPNSVFESNKRQLGCKSRHTDFVWLLASGFWLPTNKHAKNNKTDPPPMQSEVQEMSQQLLTTPVLSKATHSSEDTSQLLFFQGSIPPPVKCREPLSLHQSSRPQSPQVLCLPFPEVDSLHRKSLQGDQTSLNPSCHRAKSHSNETAETKQKLRKFSVSWLSDPLFLSWLTLVGQR